ERTPLPPDRAPKVEAVRARLDKVRTLGSGAQRWSEAKSEAVAARTEADAIAWSPLRAEAAFELGRVLRRLGETEVEPVLSDAASLAEQAHDDRLQVRALTALINALAGVLRSGDRALLIARLAEGAVERAGGGDELHGHLDSARARALFTLGRYDE